MLVQELVCDALQGGDPDPSRHEQEHLVAVPEHVDRGAAVRAFNVDLEVLPGAGLQQAGESLLGVPTQGPHAGLVMQAQQRFPIGSSHK